MKNKIPQRLAKASFLIILLSLLSSCVVLWPSGWRGEHHDRSFHAREHHHDDD
ncbi:MAG: hypothetical protein HKM05_11960 [Spirochaetales bacterium]|nr:hypothetical protein [Spirochaetales bacterium]